MQRGHSWTWIAMKILCQVIVKQTLLMTVRSVNYLQSSHRIKCYDLTALLFSHTIVWSWLSAGIWWQCKIKPADSFYKPLYFAKRQILSLNYGIASCLAGARMYNPGPRALYTKFSCIIGTPQLSVLLTTVWLVVFEGLIIRFVHNFAGF